MDMVDSYGDAGDRDGVNANGHGGQRREFC
jgi:hypothetical protein